MGTEVSAVRAIVRVTIHTKHTTHQDTEEEARSPNSSVGDHGEGYERLVSFPVVVDSPDNKVAGESTEEADDGCTVPCIPVTTLAEVIGYEQTVVLTRCRPTV